jgi:hypothetical protein
MSVSTAIGLVSQSLQNLLVGEMSLAPPPEVTVLGPDEAGEQRRLNLFLYKIEEHPFLRNQDWQVRPGTNQLTPPPLSLKLRYLLMAYAPNDAVSQNSAAHAILGEGMRILYEFPVVPTAYLATGLQTAREEIKIALCNTDLTEIGSIWSTFSRPFRPAATFEISVVQLDSSPAAEQPMAQRVRVIGTPEVQAPFAPPIITGMTPISGTPGTVVTFSGSHLTGWRGYVRISGQLIVNGQELSADSFTATIPAGLPTGFHSIRVDISHLHRSTHFFEVTA